MVAKAFFFKYLQKTAHLKKTYKPYNFLLLNAQFSEKMFCEIKTHFSCLTVQNRTNLSFFRKIKNKPYNTIHFLNLTVLNRTNRTPYITY